MSSHDGATDEHREGYLLGQSLLRETRLEPYRLLPGDPHTRHLFIFTRDPEVLPGMAASTGSMSLTSRYPRARPGPCFAW